MKKLLIIPAAGLATRMMPLSASMSKAMIPVVGKPILAHIIDSVHEYVDHIIVVHGMHDDIPDFLKKKDYHKVSWCKQGSHDGPLGAIWSGIEYFEKHNRYNDENYYTTIWLGDTLIKDIETCKDIITENNDANTAQLGVAQVDDWSRWCLISEDAYDIIDKPIEQPDTDNALIGIYKLNYDFPVLRQTVGMLISDGEKEIKPLLESFSDETRNIIDFTRDWVDCGDLPSLYKANSALISTKARGHNSIKIERGVVHKTSNRYEQETKWYKEINYEVQNVIPLTPQYYGQTGENTYAIELCSGTTLQDLVLYHNINRRDVWENIISTVLERANIMHKDKIGKIRPFSDKYNVQDYMMFDDNIRERLESLLNDNIIDNMEHYILNDYVDDCYKYIIDNNIRGDLSRVIHGDMHFGNIFFDAATDKVKFIDPRGQWGDEITVHGNKVYDIAKFYQSILCKYCHISSDEKLTQKSSDLYDMLLDIIDNELLKYMSKEHIAASKKYAICLIASAIPCHSDNQERQHIMKNMALDLIKSGKY